MTVIHTVLFKFKPTITFEAISQIFTSLKGLRSIVPGVNRISCGPTFTTNRSAGFTHMLVVELADKQALEAYASHPAHLSILKRLTETEQVIALDIEEMDDGANA